MAKGLTGKRDGEVLFKGAAHKWGKGPGSTGQGHSWRKKSDRLIKAFEKRHAERVDVTLQTLELMGVPVGNLEPDELPLETLDNFVEAHGLEHAGVDRVLSRFERARFDHDEYGEGEQ